MPPSLSGNDSPPPAADPDTSPKRGRGRPQVTPLEPYKDLIVKLFTEDDMPIIDIARRLNVEHGLDISERTISRRLTAWGVPRKKQRTPASQELCDRILFHYNANLNDEQIAQALHTEGFEIKVKNLSRLRQKLGMRRRSRYPEFREYSDEDAEAPTASTPRLPPQKKKKTTKVAQTALIPKVSAYVEKHMNQFDASHDFGHVRRVVGLTHHIYDETRRDNSLILGEAVPHLDLQVITLAALLHDVGDKKYLEPGQDGNTLVLAALLGFGAAEELAIKVQRIVLGVSYSSEIEDPAQVQALIKKYPELAIVQDADRLDAIGAIGIGRTFTFGGAKSERGMDDSIKHFEDKLELLERMMKTQAGKRMARERTERLRLFKSWWMEEKKEAEGFLKKR